MTDQSLANSEPPDPVPSATRPELRVNGQPIHLTDLTPTGAQILTSASLRPAPEHVLLLWPAQGPTRVIELDEVIDRGETGALDFLAVKDDEIAYFMLDDERYAWAGPLTAQDVRRVGRVDEAAELVLDREGQPDRALEPTDHIALERDGVERLRTRKKTWRLDVHGVDTSWDRPSVRVRDALVAAGRDPDRPATIIFKTQGGDREVGLEDMLDLSQPGIERLWVRPRQVNNGDGLSQRRRDFGLLPRDLAFLERMGHVWDAVDDGRRWLILRDFPLPAHFQVRTCHLAIEMPTGYPSSQLDMFYCDPPLVLPAGHRPANADVRQVIEGREYQRWSRHPEDGVWNPATDGLDTHFGLIELSLIRERPA